jgi:2-polyprenyl-3-methyl-5-hydroxy-6-metoxy-1,4-benzoquinol methylase
LSDLSIRSTQPEEMDNESTSPETYARCLRDLSRVNALTFTHRATLNWLGRVTRGLPEGTPVSILDIACGHGDLLRAISRWAKRRGLAVSLQGIDLNPRSALVAAEATPPGMDIRYVTGDVFQYDPEPLPQLIVTSQFTHHLSNDELLRFLKWLEAHAARAWFIADLHRHVLAYYGFPVLARLAGFHRIVRQDGQISIARSFRKTEWMDLLVEAGIPADVRWSLPFRYCVSRVK